MQRFGAAHTGSAVRLLGAKKQVHEFDVIVPDREQHGRLLKRVPIVEIDVARHKKMADHGVPPELDGQHEGRHARAVCLHDGVNVDLGDRQGVHHSLLSRLR